MTSKIPFEALYTVGAPDECWLWEGTVDPSTGYGRYGKRRAHVIACEDAHGPKPVRNGVRHSCNVKLCVNPAHLQWGSQAENCHDVARSGVRKGERSHMARLNDDKVREIRRSPESTAALARKFGVRWVTVYYARTRRTWTHVT